MIRGFRHKGLERFFLRGDHRGIPARSGARIERMLDRLDASVRPEDMNLPGYRFHGLRGDRSGSFAVSVSGNLRITFSFDGENAVDIDSRTTTDAKPAKSQPAPYSPRSDPT